MNEQEILRKGYKEYRKTPFDSEWVEKCFQKRFDDDVGKRYFIDIKKYSPMKHPSTGETILEGYEYSLQMYQKETHNPINLEFFAGWELDDVEEFVERMFDSGWFDYYEKWE